MDKTTQQQIRDWLERETGKKWLVAWNGHIGKWEALSEGPRLTANAWDEVVRAQWRHVLKRWGWSRRD